MNQNSFNDEQKNNNQLQTRTQNLSNNQNNIRNTCQTIFFCCIYMIYGIGLFLLICWGMEELGFQTGEDNVPTE